MSKRKPKGYWTLERCMEDAAQHSSKSKWRLDGEGAYDAARRNGWLDQCCEHMTGFKPKGYWTLERCMESAANFNRSSKWQMGDGAAFTSAHRKGWLDQCCAHMERAKKPNGYWTLERCMEDALRFCSRGAWQVGSPTVYSLAYRNGLLDQCCAHMERAGGTDNDVVYLWQDSGTGLHKIGITSDKWGEKRITMCKQHNDMDPRIVFMLKVDDARAVESQLLELGTDPQLDSSIDGYTEFRELTNDDLREAVSIAYSAALAA